MRWSPARYDELETATRTQCRVALVRHGQEIVVIAMGLTMSDRRESLVCRIPMTGENLVVPLDEIEAFQVVEG